MPRSPSEVASSIAWAALTTRLRKTWLMSPPSQMDGRQLGEVVLTSAMYLYSLAATTSVLRSAWLMSDGALSVVGGWANSRMARTMVATRWTPSVARSKAPGTRSRR